MIKYELTEEEYSKKDLSQENIKANEDYKEKKEEERKVTPSRELSTELILVTMDTIERHMMKI